MRIVLRGQVCSSDNKCIEKKSLGEKCSNSDQCDPYRCSGGVCKKRTSSRTTTTVYVSVDEKCGYQNGRRIYRCKSSAGLTCDRNSDTNSCKYTRGTDCTLNQNSCVSNTKCLPDSGTKVNYRCRATESGTGCVSSNECGTGLTCENLTCKVKVGSPCSDNQCVNGASCGPPDNSGNINTRTCIQDSVLRAGSLCNNAIQCTSSICELDNVDKTMRCKALTNGVCSANSPCANGLSCVDSDGDSATPKVCRLQGGSTCTGNNECAPGTLCEDRLGKSAWTRISEAGVNYKICRVNVLDGVCSDDVSCASGFICQNNKCKIRVSNACNVFEEGGTESCEETTFCVKGTCTELPKNGILIRDLALEATSLSRVADITESDENGTQKIVLNATSAIEQSVNVSFFAKSDNIPFSCTLAREKTRDDYDTGLTIPEEAREDTPSFYSPNDFVKGVLVSPAAYTPKESDVYHVFNIPGVPGDNTSYKVELVRTIKNSLVGSYTSRITNITRYTNSDRNETRRIKFTCKGTIPETDDDGNTIMTPIEETALLDVEFQRKSKPSRSSRRSSGGGGAAGPSSPTVLGIGDTGCDTLNLHICNTSISICENNTCKGLPNTTCDASLANQCSDTLSCDNGLCKRNPGGECVTNQNCVSTAICQDDDGDSTTPRVCKVNVIDGGCLNRQCADGLSCVDADGNSATPKVCKVNIGNACTVNDNCLSGAVCDSGFCKVAVGNACTGNNQCVSGASCGLGANSVCVPDNSVVIDDRCVDSRQCANGLSCGVDNTCISSGSVPIGNACAVNDNCLSGAVCDNNVCKVAVGNACTGNNQCVTNSVCENNRCKISVGNACTGNNQCVSGAACRGSPAVCKVVVAVGGSCTVNDNCLSGAVCDSGFCKVAVGGSCAGDLATRCVSTASCGIVNGARSCVGIGSVVMGGDCTDVVQCNTQVTENVVCVDDDNDAVTAKVCKVGEDGTCTETAECMGTASCIDNVCITDGSLGESCDAHTRCGPGLTCENNSCRINVPNVACTPRANHCADGFICDGRPSLCKVALDHPCLPTTNPLDSVCQSGTACSETTNHCVIKGDLILGAVCSDNIQCRNSGASCGNILYSSADDGFTVGLDNLRYGFGRITSHQYGGDVNASYGSAPNLAFILENREVTLGVVDFIDTGETFRVGFEPESYELDLRNRLNIVLVNASGDTLVNRTLSSGTVENSGSPTQKFIFNLNTTEQRLIGPLLIEQAKFGLSITLLSESRVCTTGGITPTPPPVILPTSPSEVARSSRTTTIAVKSIRSSTYDFCVVPGEQIFFTAALRSDADVSARVLIPELGITSATTIIREDRSGKIPLLIPSTVAEGRYFLRFSFSDKYGGRTAKYHELIVDSNFC